MRSFRINIDVVDRTRHGSELSILDRDKGDYRIVVDQEQVRKMGVQPYPVVLHELGHLIGYEFQMPRHMAYYMGIGADFESAIMARENEAWDMAEVMAQMTRVRRYALGTYSESFAMQKRYEELTHELWKWGSCPAEPRGKP